MKTVENPPPFGLTNVMEISSIENSKITGVSLYSGRAEITRLYKLKIKTGQNQVIIKGLPTSIDQSSLRVEGRGAATIHDVTVSYTPAPPAVTTSTALSAFELKKERTQKAIERCRKSLASLETYVGTLNVERIDVSQIGNVVEKYDTEAAKLDDKLLELEKQLQETNQEIQDERKKLTGPVRNVQLGLQASIGVFAELEDQVEIALIYAVANASWKAAYDIRVDMQTKETPVTLIYKAAITQSTGEAWEDVPLTLETATPTFGVSIPKLNPWHLSIYKPMPAWSAPVSFSVAPQAVGGAGGTVRRRARHAIQEEYSAPAGLVDDDDYDRLMTHREVNVSSKGNVSATFRVPGLITVPSDGQHHNVTIVQLKLDAALSWIAVPKEDTKTHLKAKIKNASEYSLLAGTASVYVDGSFISRSDVPSVSPQESFDCPLGVDPSIRVTYHPRSKRVSQSGFYRATANHVFSQRITIFNTKSTAVDNVKIVDQIPVSEDSQIAVKLTSPALIVPSNPGTTNGAPNIKAVQPLKVSSGIVAQWDGVDEPGFDVLALAKDGKLNWICSVPSQEKVNFNLEWAVTAPVGVSVTGL
ncbi:hypothetical protein BD410DRAFT_782988 [Rickenella mellea]|uniref:Mucoidy inhibitor A n=1 Tax=Rickenella mellea TaxID=50990 RepID=A0A4Y7QI43_9AGAM|nr:hypothetical protein BD410DRAFT_782988 [Rickenella mellea]